MLSVYCWGLHSLQSHPLLFKMDIKDISSRDHAFILHPEGESCFMQQLKYDAALKKKKIQTAQEESAVEMPKI